MPKVSRAHRESRRQQILEAAITCFAREGFHRTSIQDIIAESGLSAGAIYGYFAGKDAIVAAIAENRHAHEAAMLARAMARDDLTTALHDLAHGYVDWLRDPDERRRRRVNIQLWAEALRNPEVGAIVQRGLELREPITRAFRAARRRGRIPASLDPDALSRAMLALLHGFILQQAWEPGIDAEAFLTVVEHVIDGLGRGADVRGRSQARRRGKRS